MLLTNAGRRGGRLLGAAALVGVVIAGALSVAPADAAQAASRPSLANGLVVPHDANGLTVRPGDANGL